MKITNEAKLFLVENRKKIKAITKESIEDWYKERYQFYRANWKSFGIEAHFSQKLLIQNLECDIENLK